jgi:ribonuclease P protein subunit POP4
MAINPQNILRHELIGLEIKITGSSNKALIGMLGRIVDETRNTITLAVGEKLKKVPKAQIVFETAINNQVVSVDGKMLVGRPEDRAKR